MTTLDEIQALIELRTRQEHDSSEIVRELYKKITGKTITEYILSRVVPSKRLKPSHTTNSVVVATSFLQSLKGN